MPSLAVDKGDKMAGQVCWSTPVDWSPHVQASTVRDMPACISNSGLLLLFSVFYNRCCMQSPAVPLKPSIGLNHGGDLDSADQSDGVGSSRGRSEVTFEVRVQACLIFVYYFFVLKRIKEQGQGEIREESLSPFPLLNGPTAARPCIH